MIAVVYSGSRHADWKLAEKGKIVSEFKTPGINPFFSDENHIFQLLDKSVELINNAEKIHWVYFFGAGASSKERQDIVTNALSSFFRFSKIVVDVHVANFVQVVQHEVFYLLLARMLNKVVSDSHENARNRTFGAILKEPIFF
jgi:hypothetical protein